ncbi:MAG: hypothetical protein ABJ327_25615, partial [Litoreibacter sp.]
MLDFETLIASWLVPVNVRSGPEADSVTLGGKQTFTAGAKVHFAIGELGLLQFGFKYSVAQVLILELLWGDPLARFI